MEMVGNGVMSEKWMDFEGKRVRVKICEAGNALGCDDLRRWKRAPRRAKLGLIG